MKSHSNTSRHEPSATRPDQPGCAQLGRRPLSNRMLGVAVALFVPLSGSGSQRVVLHRARPLLRPPPLPRRRPAAQLALPVTRCRAGGLTLGRRTPPAERSARSRTYPLRALPCRVRQVRRSLSRRPHRPPMTRGTKKSVGAPSPRRDRARTRQGQQYDNHRITGHPGTRDRSVEGVGERDRVQESQPARVQERGSDPGDSVTVEPELAVHTMANGCDHGPRGCRASPAPVLRDRTQSRSSVTGAGARSS